jgi:HEPN domain-containing protein
MTDISTGLFEHENLAQEGQQVPEWLARPFQLVSLLEMIKQYGFVVFLMTEKVVAAEERLKRLKQSDLVDADLKAAMSDTYTSFHKACGSIELASSADQLKRILSELRNEHLTNGHLKELLSDLHRRIYDDTSRIWLFHVPSSRLMYYGDKPLFGERVASKFPKAIEDIQEAGKCLAVARYTACVFHLMRVMEIGVQRFGQKLGVKLAEEKEWGTILNKITDKLDAKYPPKTHLTRHQKAARDRYAEAVTYLTNVKNAWRNQTMHPKRTYTPDEAERVFRFAKDYMEYLATIV